MVWVQDGKKRYEGAWLRGRQHGQGMYWYPNGETYCGANPSQPICAPASNERHSCRKSVSPIADTLIAIMPKSLAICPLSPGFQALAMCLGHAQRPWCQHPTIPGTIHPGAWIADQRHGRGRMDYLDGSWFEGDWVHGERRGQGRMRTAAGDVFIGPFVDGRREGPGVLLMVREPQYGPPKLLFESASSSVVQPVLCRSPL